MTWPQNVGNRISKFSGGGYPRTPLQGTAFGGPNIEPPSVKSWIGPRVWIFRRAFVCHDCPILEECQSLGWKHCGPSSYGNWKNAHDLRNST